VNKFLDSLDLLKLIQETISHFNRPVIGNEVEAIMKSIPRKKNAGSVGFITEFYQTLKDVLTPMLLKLFHELESEFT
jgi:hypothetical protein